MTCLKSKVSSAFFALLAIVSIVVACGVATTPQPAFAAGSGEGNLAAGDVSVGTLTAIDDWVISGVSKNTVKLLQYTGSDANVVVPSKINGDKVVALGEGLAENGVFGSYYDDNLEDWVQPKVKSVTIPSTVTSIGFKEKPNYSEDIYPVAKIGKMRSYDLGSRYLQKITVAKKNPNFKSVKGVLFNKKGTKLLCYPPAKKGKSYAVPEGVKTIGYRAFSGASVTNVTIAKSVRKIEPFAFQNSKVKKVDFKPGVKTIGNFAFYQAYKLKSVNFPKTLKKIGEAAFAELANSGDDPKTMKALVFNDGLEEIGDSAFWFSGKYSKHTVVIPKSVKKIGSYAFYMFDRDSNYEPNATFKVPKSTKLSISGGEQCSIDAKKIIYY